MGAPRFEPGAVTGSPDRDLGQATRAGGAKSGALGAVSRKIAPELQEVIDAWPGLPEDVKAGIVAMVRERSGRHESPDGRS